jgi:uncharacterized membrane protein
MASIPLADQGPPLSARRDPGPNVTGSEKWASIATGGVLAAYGVKRGGLVGLVSALFGANLIARGVTGHSPGKRALLPSETEKQLAEQEGWKFAAPLSRAVGINKPPEEVYAFFRDFNNLPKFMDNIERIDVIDDKRSHWVVKAPGGRTVKWDSTITEEEPGKRFAYQSEEGGDINNKGVVEFRPGAGGKGTALHVTIIFEPPFGMVGRAVAALFMKDPAIQLRQDLVRLKMLLETGEIATSKAPDAAPRDPKAIQPILHT